MKRFILITIGLLLGVNSLLLGQVKETFCEVYVRVVNAYQPDDEAVTILVYPHYSNKGDVIVDRYPYHSEGSILYPSNLIIRKLEVRYIASGGYTTHSFYINVNSFTPEKHCTTMYLGNILELEIRPHYSMAFKDVRGHFVDISKECALPSSGSVEVGTTAGYGSYYYWEYSLNSGKNWYDLPQCKGKHTIYFSSSDIPDIYATALANKTNIQLRMKTCGETETVILVPQVSSPSIVSVKETAPLCHNSSDGKLLLTFDRALLAGEELNIINRGQRVASLPSGSTEYELTGLPSSGGHIDTIRLAGSYNGIRVYDSDPVDHIKTYSLISPPEVTVTGVTSAPPACFGGSTGVLQLSGSGGSGTFTAEHHHNGSWLGSASTSLTGLSSGSYPVRLKDSHGCLSAESIGVVSSPSAVSFSGFSLEVPQGHSTTDGSIRVTGAGGTGGYTYSLYSQGTQLSTNSTGHFTGLGGGSYTVRVSDGNSCYTERDGTLTAPDLLEVIDISVSQSISCKGRSDGSLTITARGGVSSSYLYLLENEVDGVWSLCRQQAGVSSFFNLSSGRYRVRVKDNNNIYSAYRETILSEPSSLELETQSTLPLCHGDSNGLLQVQGVGGTSPYRYQWSDGITSSIHSDLSRGSYLVNIEDANGCSKQAYVTLLEPDPLSVIGSVSLPTVYGGDDGAITLTVEGGTSPYAYVWNIASGTGNPLSGLSSRDMPYIATITDVNGCTIQWDTVLLNPIDITLAVIDSISCNGRHDGSLGSTVRGGIGGPYRYLWEEEVSSGEYYPLSLDKSLFNLGSGRYRLTVSDQVGNITVSPLFIFNSPDSLVTVLSSLSPSCNGYRDGWYDANPVGGTAPYHYTWSTGNTTSLITDLASGYYHITVTDRRHCQSLNRNLLLSEPAPLVASHELTIPSSPDSFDGQILLLVEGGTSPYHYQWDNPQSTANPLSGIAARDSVYQATVTDSHGCILSVRSRLLYPLTGSIQIQDSIFCVGYHNGSLLARTVGGVGNRYYYRWYRLEDGRSIDLSVTDSLLRGIGAGEYQYRVFDIENTTTLSPVFMLGTPPLLETTLTVRDLLCKNDHDGAAEVFVSGGTPPYHYRWDSGVLTKSIGSLTEGDYTVRVTDSRGCFVDGIVGIHSPEELSLSFYFRSPRAFHFTDGMVRAAVSGGTPSYSYQWKASPVGVDSLTSIGAGFCTSIVTDAHGCSKEGRVEVTEPALLEVSVTEGHPVSCYGMNDGQLTAWGSGGVSPYFFTWYKESAGLWIQTGTGQILDNLTVGNYRVHVMDQNGIIALSETYILSEPEPLIIQVKSNSISCNGDRNGVVEALVSGGTLPYRYLWTTNDTMSILTGVTDGRYRVFVSDNRGCDVEGRGEVTVPDGLKIYSTLRHPVCHNGKDGEIALDVSGGVPPYRGEWYSGVYPSGLVLDNLISGDYLFRLTDSIGCFREEVYTLENPDSLRVMLGEDLTLCSEQEVELDASHPSPDIQYRWFRDGKLFSESAYVNVRTAGHYEVSLRDKNGCQGGGSLDITTSPDLITASFAMSTEIRPGEELQLVNTSYPSPERVEWIIPEDAEVSLINWNEEYAGVVIHSPGIYKLGIKAWKGACHQVLYKSVIVKEDTVDSEPTRSNEPFVKKYILWPNPNKGEFKVAIALREEAEICLLLFHVSGRLVDERVLCGEKEYNIDYQSELQSGIYILQLICGKNKEALKLLVR